MGDVYDFRTGRLYKRCKQCRYWKDLDDFPPGDGEYDRLPFCYDCAGIAQMAEKTEDDVA